VRGSSQSGAVCPKPLDFLKVEPEAMECFIDGLRKAGLSE
jgi:hypothetical protein